MNGYKISEHKTEKEIKKACDIILDHNLNFCNVKDPLYTPYYWDSCISIVIRNIEYYEISSVYIAQNETGPIGCSLFHKYPVCSNIKIQVYVLPEYRRQGIGSMLVKLAAGISPELRGPLKMGDGVIQW